MLSLIRLPACYEFDEEDVDLLNFMIKKSKNVDFPFSLKQLYSEYSTKKISQCQRSSKTCLSSHAFYRKITKLRSKLPLVDDLDIDTKVKMMFAISVKIDNNFLNELKKEAYVEVDHQNRIIKYEKNGGGLNLTGTHAARSTTQNLLERDKQMMNFLAEKCKHVNTPMKAVDFTKQFKASTGCGLMINQLCARYKLIKEKIHNSTDIDKSTRIKMMFISKTSVHEDILKELRKDAIVEVDKHRRITKYTSNDGILTLNGDHSVPAKNKAKRSMKIRQRHSSDTFEDEVVDIDDDEEEREAEKSDDEEEARKNNDMKNNTITESRRIKKAKTGKSTGITPTVSRLILQKRRIVDTSSTSEAPLKVAKTRNMADIQNEKTLTNCTSSAARTHIGKVDVSASSVTKRGSIDGHPMSEISQSNDDVVYDGPGEPSLPILLPIKPEREDNYEYGHERKEYRPDRSELSNHISDDDCKNPQGLMKNPIDDIVKIEETETPEIICDTPFVPINSSARNEAENTAELTSSKNFMNFLRGLIVTLDTPMLAVLQRKIENTIEELGNEEKIPATDILTALRTIFIAVRKSAKPIQPSKDSKSLVGFLMMLRNSVISMNLSVLNNIQEEMKEAIKELDSQDKSVPIQRIRIVLDAVLLMFTS